MGIMDQVGKVLGGEPEEGSGQSPLLKGVLEMLGQGKSGGLAGLVQAFQAKGLGEIVSSWVSTGENLPISAQQLQQGMGREQLQQLAAKVGISSEAASAMLANILPGVVDKLTPTGAIPEGGLLEQGLSFLKSKLR